MNNPKKPTWWTKDNDSAWERTKAAFQRDWDQTKHDVGSAKKPDLNQNANDTVKQAAGKEVIPPANQPNFKEVEPAYRFGHGAQTNFGKKYPKWNDEIATQLETDWKSTYPDRSAQWDSDRKAIRHGWEFRG